MLTKNNRRIFIVTDYLIDYRIDIFTDLSKHFDTTVFYRGIHEKLNVKVRKNWRYLKKFCKKLPKNKLLALLTLSYHLIKCSNKAVIIFNNALSYLVLAMIIVKMIRFRLVKTILWDESWFYPNGVRFKLFYPLHRLIVKVSDLIIVPGELPKHFYLKLGAKVKNIRILPNITKLSITENFISAANCMRETLNLRNKIVLLYFGRLIPVKNVKSLIRTFIKSNLCNNNNMVLIIAGEGPDLKELKQEAKNCSNILFLNPVYDESKIIYYLLSDVVIIPSRKYKGRFDTWPLTSLEALMVGRPVVLSSHVGSAIDLKHLSDAVLIFDAEKEDSLIDILKSLSYSQVVELLKSKAEAVKKLQLYQYHLKKLISTLNKSFRNQHPID